ncbi:MAG: DegT/DnrJ/EryC1/StrS family aminotransferase, partial [Chloroflexota bacterium]
MTSNPLRSLPSISRLLDDPSGIDLTARYGHDATVTTLRAVLDEVRTAIQRGDDLPAEPSDLLNAAAARLSRERRTTLRPVINATGVIIHTNLGRAPLSEDAIHAMTAAAGYTTLEFNLDTGRRGSRNVHPERALSDLTGAEAALVVNNAASALVLTLTALATDREVIVSRGQAVEIGGGFRIPD